MTRTGFVTGLGVEARALRVGARARGDDAVPEIVVAGGSALRAEDGVRAMAARGVEAFLSFGMAGALAPGLAPGDILLPRRVCGPDGALYPVDHAWRDDIGRSLSRLAGRVADAPLAGRDEAVTTAAAKAALRRETDAIAVDMESHGVARAAAALGCPFAVLRVVADRADQSVPAAALAGMGPDGETRPLAVMLALLRRPGSLPALLALAGAARTAMTVLRGAAARPILLVRS